jgi:excisionase family DNA binding protein
LELSASPSEMVEETGGLPTPVPARYDTVVPSPGTAAVNDQSPRDPAEYLMTPAEVAQTFRVDPKTVSRWAISGRVGSIRTPGGHRRYRRSEIAALMAGLTQQVGERA